MYDVRHGSALGVPSRGGRGIAVTLFCGVFVAVTVLVLTSALTGTGIAGQAVAGAKRPASMAALTGDTDPCQLVDTTRLTGFGTPVLHGDYGPYGACEIALGDRSGTTAMVHVYLNAPDEETSTDATTGRLGALTVYRWAQTDGTCDRVLSTGTPETTPSVTVSVDTGDGTTSGHTDLCAIGDRVADGLAGALTRRLPAAPPGAAADSITRVDACTLLDGGDLGRVPGTDGSAVLRGFGNWSCYWGADGNVSVVFGRYFPAAGRERLVSPSPRGCRVDLLRGRFTSVDGSTRVETATINVDTGDGVDGKRACSIAGNLATAVSDRLPPV